MTHALLVASLLWPGNGLFGVDKLKHFFLSAFVHSAAYSVARVAGADRGAAQAAGAALAMSVGVAKEIHDRRSGRVFSKADLVWDAAGSLAAAAILNGSK